MQNERKKTKKNSRNEAKSNSRCAQSPFRSRCCRAITQFCFFYVFLLFFFLFYSFRLPQFNRASALSQQLKNCVRFGLGSFVTTPSRRNEYARLSVATRIAPIYTAVCGSHYGATKSDDIARISLHFYHLLRLNFT